MEEQHSVTQQSQQTAKVKKNPMKVILLTLLGLLVLGGAFSVYGYTTSYMNEVKLLQQDLADAEKAKEAPANSVSQAPQSDRLSDPLLAESAAKNYCVGANFGSCAPEEVNTKLGGTEIKVKDVANSGDTYSLLVKKQSDETWLVVIAGKGMSVCDIGTDSPDVMAYCKD